MIMNREVVLSSVIYSLVFPKIIKLTGITGSINKPSGEAKKVPIIIVRAEL